MGARGRIVSIVPHARRRHQYTLRFERGDELTLHEDVIVALGLQVGTRVTEQALSAVRAEEQAHQARQAALRLLEYRARSRKELLLALRGKGFGDSAVDKALAELENMGLINDEAFARDHARSLLRRHIGRQGLLYRLRQSGVDDEVARAAVDEAFADMDESERAVEALGKQARRWHKVPAQKRRQRAYQFLARRGFAPDAIATAIRKALPDAPDPDEF